MSLVSFGTPYAGRVGALPQAAFEASYFRFGSVVSGQVERDSVVTSMRSRTIQVLLLSHL